MTTDTVEEDFEIIDVQALDKAAREVMSAADYSQKFEKLDHYVPSKCQLEFHNTIAIERMFLAGSQMGKTYAVGYEVACHATLRYPSWWQGHRFMPKRNEDMIFWCGSPTAQMSRDGCLKRLLGNTLAKDEIGTGFLPKASIQEYHRARGIIGFVDTIVVLRDDGGKTYIRFKTHEQDRQAWQSESCKLLWFDEAMDDFSLYTEGLTRTNAVEGIVLVSETPLLGRDLLIQHFENETPNRRTVKMTIYDVPDTQISAERKRYLLDEQYQNEAERACRLFAVPMLGSGKIWTRPWEEITHNLRLEDIGRGWKCIGGMDFGDGTSASAHPAAFVTMVFDPETGVYYIMEAWTQKGESILSHCERIKQSRLGSLCEWHWPADMNSTATGALDGSTIAQQYKRQGVNMYYTWATHPEKGYSTSTGIALMDEAFRHDLLKVGAGLHDFRKEYENYHTDARGKIVKVFDDILSAARVAFMDRRFMKSLDVANGGELRKKRNTQKYAIGTEKTYWGFPDDD